MLCEKKNEMERLIAAPMLFEKKHHRNGKIDAIRMLKVMKKYTLVSGDVNTTRQLSSDNK
jgi:hypothetical protein